MRNETSDKIGATSAFRPAYYSCLIILALCIVAINILVVFLFVRKDFLRTKTNCFLVSLALSDLMTGLLSIPLYLLCPNAGIQMCIASAAFYRCVAVSTMIHILVVTLERYVAVMYPMRYYRMVTKRRVCFVISVVWLFSVLYAVIVFAWLDVSNHNISDVGNMKKYVVAFNVTGLLLCFAIPLFIMIYCFSRMFLVIRRQVRNIQKQAELATDPRNRSIASDKRALIIFATMLGIFVVCWLSWYFTLLQVSLGENYFLPNVIQDVLNFFRFGTSLFNPLLYTFLKHDFRRAVASVCNCCPKTMTMMISHSRRDSNAVRTTLTTDANNGKFAASSWNGSPAIHVRAEYYALYQPKGNDGANVQLVSNL